MSQDASKASSRSVSGSRKVHFIKTVTFQNIAVNTAMLLIFVVVITQLLTSMKSMSSTSFSIFTNTSKLMSDEAVVKKDIAYLDGQTSVYVSIYDLLDADSRKSRVTDLQTAESEADTALQDMTALMKETRDRNFVKEEVVKGKSYTVNRNEGMAMLGAAALDNEECYLLGKFARAMGVSYLEHQARI